MFGSIGPMEIGIVALVVVLLFGVGKISGLGRELGSSIKEFRKAVKDPEEEQPEPQQKLTAAAPPPPQYVQQPPQYAPPPAPQHYAPPAPPPAPQQPAPTGQGESKNIF